MFVAFVSHALFSVSSVWYDSVSRTVFSVLCLIGCDVNVSRTVFSVFFLAVCYVSASRGVFCVLFFFCL